MIAKIKNIVTRRILKFLEDEMKRDSEEYDKWFKDFSMFLKEGVMSDNENKEQLLRLMRYHSNNSIDVTISLDDYLKSMKAEQKKIYFISGQAPKEALNNPFMEPFKESDVPVLIVNNQIDEMIFQQIGTYKGYTFVNVESGYEEIAKDLGDKQVERDANQPSLPEEDVTQFSLWLKENTKPYVGKVTLSKRISSVPAVLYGQVSA